MERWTDRLTFLYACALRASGLSHEVAEERAKRVKYTLASMLASDLAYPGS